MNENAYSQKEYRIIQRKEVRDLNYQIVVSLSLKYKSPRILVVIFFNITE